MSVNLGRTPPIGFIDPDRNSIGGQCVVNSGTHIVLNVLVPKRKTAKGTHDGTTRHGTARQMSHDGTRSGTVTPIITD